MLSNIITSANEMTKKLEMQDVVSNNLANINTNGFKKDMINFRKVFDAKQNDFITETKISTDFTQGNMVLSGNAFDLAVNGDGFFAVEDGNNELFTRNGAFSKNSEGYLVTQMGRKVLSDNGPIIVEGNDFLVDKQGGVWVDNEYRGTLKIVSFQEINKLQKAQSNGLFENLGSSFILNPQTNGECEVLQNTLEKSNVSSTSEMIDMIKISNEYQTNYRVLDIINELTKKSIQELSKV
ncbi:MAG: flagellar hook basal-body protein [Candidatus Cloacimonadota bacterium]|nr:flagellar hook basal-body protein [Candidatus Cloacimonadota bacterium]